MNTLEDLREQVRVLTRVLDVFGFSDNFSVHEFTVICKIVVRLEDRIKQIKNKQRHSLPE